jgi:ribosomal-protein-alanine N-acetyltransferase
MPPRAPYKLETERLVLRRWRDDDRAAFAHINADPRVMEFFPATLTREDSDALIDRIEAHWHTHGFGLYAADLKVGARDGRGSDERQFVGFIGLARPSFEIDFTPCIEIGWRLDASAWGRGLATEGARAVAEHAIGPLGLDEIVSFTSVGNARSRRVMEKIGMTHDPRDDFEHPQLPEGHALRRHVLYRLRRLVVH